MGGYVEVTNTECCAWNKKDRPFDVHVHQIAQKKPTSNAGNFRCSDHIFEKGRKKGRSEGNVKIPSAHG